MFDQPNSDLRLFNVGTLIELLSISRSTLYRLMKADGFPRPVSLGSRNLWRGDDVKRWLDMRSSAPTITPAHSRREEIDDFI